SRHEGSGIALIEACACGVTPAVTDIHSFRAITGDGAIGALWAPGNAGACARAMVAAAAPCGRDQRQRVVAHFRRTLSWSAVGARALAAYEDVRAHHSARRQAR